ncbi:MAG: 30S ribosomal protein S5, partial [Polyangiaceae bacterium]|nr:30S ribosomal protein S5 [Polyangiaceae bacterium]
HFGAGKVVLRPASAGTGVIAGGAMRPVLEAAGIRDVLAKILGTTNPHNVVHATAEALKGLEDAKMVAERRGLRLDESVAQ